MKHSKLQTFFKTGMRIFLLLALFFFTFSSGNTQTASASSIPQDSGACNQTLVQAENQFLHARSGDGASRSAALAYIQAAANCYDQFSTPQAAQQGDTPILIDEGGIKRSQDLSAEYVLGDAKWGASTLGTTGGVVTYSFMGNGLDLGKEEVPAYGNSVALSSLSGYKSCFITEIENAFAAWSAAANIQFREVADSNTAFDANNATGDIRIGAHYFDGNSNVLAHAYYPYPGWTGNGDLHFDKDENWTCDASGIDIGIVALHEIGHVLGLQHEDTSTVAVMDPYYNSSLSTLRSDDINGAEALYGPAAVCTSFDDFDCAKVVNTIPYVDNDSTLFATTSGDDPQVNVLCDGVLLNKGIATVWYKYTQTSGVTKKVSFDTLGTEYDTYIAIWTGSRGNLSLVACDDDTFSGLQSQVGVSAASGTTYYIEVAEYNGFHSASATSLSSKPAVQPQTNGGSLAFHVNDQSHVQVAIGGALQGQYDVPIQDEVRPSYPGLDNGPVRVLSTNGVPIVSALRDLWWNGSAYSSSIQLMGLPEGQLSTTYVFPSYNNVTLNDQLRFGNVGNESTTVTVTIGGVVRGTYNLLPNARQKVNYVGLDSGPVIVQGSNPNAPIIASIRDAWIVNGTTTSFSQLMGLPQGQLSDTYVFPSYNNVNLSDQLRFGNVDTFPTTVTVTIGGIVRGNYNLQPSERFKVDYPGLDSGPVVVKSSNGARIIASLREAWLNNGVTSSYFQMMGLPQSQLSTTYVFPSYDNVTLSGQLRFGNVGNANTTVTVTIGGQFMGSYPLGPSQRQKVSYAGLNDGPIVVQSSNGVPIIASLRDAWLTSGVTTSFSQLMGLPGGQISNIYVFPSYNNATYDNQLRIAAP